MYWPTLTDYEEAFQHLDLHALSSELKQGSLLRQSFPRGISGGNAIVYPVKCDGKKYAVRCFQRKLPERQYRYEQLSRHLKKRKPSCMVDFDYQPQGIKIHNQCYPILKMEWVEGLSLDFYIEQNIHNAPVLTDLTQKWITTTRELRQTGIAHNDLQHENIRISNGIKLIDYDSTYLPSLKGMSAVEVGHPDYQHPARTNADYDTYIDNFPSWAIYLSLQAISLYPQLWREIRGKKEGLLLHKEDFINPHSSKALARIESTGDKRLQELVRSFRIFCKLPLAAIPPIGDSQILTSLLSVNYNLPEWIRGYVTNEGTARPPELSIFQYNYMDNELRQIRRDALNIRKRVNTLIKMGKQLWT